MNKPIDALILKRVVINLQIDFPSQQEMRRSSLEGTKGVRRLWGTDVLTADQKKVGEGQLSIGTEGLRHEDLRTKKGTSIWDHHEVQGMFLKLQSLDQRQDHWEM